MSTDNQHLFILLYKILESLNEIKHVLNCRMEDEYILNDYIINYVETEELNPNWYMNEYLQNDCYFEEECIVDEYVDEECIVDECIVNECIVDEECIVE
jgi:hypothetical protein